MKNIMLIERSQTQNVTYYIIICRIDKSTETKSMLVVSRVVRKNVRSS